MGHKVFICDIAVIERKQELPDECPRCHTKFEAGSTDVISTQLRPHQEKLRLIEVKDKGLITDVFQTTRSACPPHAARMPTAFVCAKCQTPLLGSVFRLYRLADMSKRMAFKLRGLLYDANALDPIVKRKCYEQTEEYRSDCTACNIEAEIGTEEVPHPIDPRIHTCKRSKDVVDQSR